MTSEELMRSVGDKVRSGEAKDWPEAWAQLLKEIRDAGGSVTNGHGEELT